MRIFIPTLLSLFLLLPSSASADHVQHIGEVDLRHYSCQYTPESSFISYICVATDSRHQPNVIASLNRRNYGWCGVPDHIATGWLMASSKGDYFNTYIKGNYTCRY